mmetsp:Transcript_55033/g.98107  ORF Transcript_55033/g.98107 Transcript_55033/m.98107 type:complete len:638 (+) Transcript_55033:81-1994(+)
MGNEVSAPKNFHTSKQALLRQWQRRPFQEQLFAVVRHTERADGLFAFHHGGRWSDTEDCARWPLDPPLSDAGEGQADGLGSQIQDFANRKKSEFHVVVTSPYLRCVQTAVRICKALGPGVKLLVDRSIGEIFGPSVMGDLPPRGQVRSLDRALDYCRENGVDCVGRAIGRHPVWPESLKDARRRFALRFLSFLQRGAKTRRNFILVTHADCVGSVLGIMPDKQDVRASKVEYGATVLGSRPAKMQLKTGQSHASSVGKGFASIVPLEEPDEEAQLMDGARSHSQESADYCIREDPVEAEGSVAFGKIAKLMAEPEEKFLADNAEIQKKTDQAMSAWQSETINVEFHEKGKKGSFAKKIATLVKSSPFSWQKVERLIGDMGDEQYADSHAAGLQNSPHRETSINFSVNSNLSMSTYLFGGSDQDPSEDHAGELISPRYSLGRQRRVSSSRLGERRGDNRSEEVPARARSATDDVSLRKSLQPVQASLEKRMTPTDEKSPELFVPSSIEPAPKQATRAQSDESMNDEHLSPFQKLLASECSQINEEGQTPPLHPKVPELASEGPASSGSLTSALAQALASRPLPVLDLPCAGDKVEGVEDELTRGGSFKSTKGGVSNLLQRRKAGVKLVLEMQGQAQTN